MVEEFKRGDGFPSAHEDARSAETMRATPQTRSPSFRLAYADTEFMLRDELRPVRLQLAQDAGDAGGRIVLVPRER